MQRERRLRRRRRARARRTPARRRWGLSRALAADRHFASGMRMSVSPARTGRVVTRPRPRPWTRRSSRGPIHEAGRDGGARSRSAASSAEEEEPTVGSRNHRANASSRSGTSPSAPTRPGGRRTPRSRPRRRRASPAGRRGRAREAPRPGARAPRRGRRRRRRTRPRPPTRRRRRASGRREQRREQEEGEGGREGGARTASRRAHPRGREPAERGVLNAKPSKRVRLGDLRSRAGNSKYWRADARVPSERTWVRAFQVNERTVSRAPNPSAFTTSQ